jgi:hypothetical protein
LIGSAALKIDLDLENTEKQTTHKGILLIEEIKTSHKSTDPSSYEDILDEKVW